MKLALIGAGNLGRALVRGLTASRTLAPEAITATDKMPEARQAFLDLAPGLHWADTIGDAVADADLVIWAVKPQQIAEALPAGAAAPPACVFVSVCAGVPLARLEALAGTGRRIVRAMPNTPALVGEGMTALAANTACSPANLEAARRIFAAVGEVVTVAEGEMDAVTALSGSGPAFFYLLLDHLAAAARAEGLTSADALRMAAQTARGAARMLLETGRPPRELMAQVTSKGGTTEAGLRVLDTPATQDLLSRTIQAAAARSRELGKG